MLESLFVKDFTRKPFLNNFHKSEGMMLRYHEQGHHHGCLSFNDAGIAPIMRIPTNQLV